MKKAILMLLLAAFSFNLQAQNVYNSSGRKNGARKQQDKGFDASKLIFGGGITADFGNVMAIGASPIIGYRISDQLAAGIGLGFQYYRIKDYNAVWNPDINNFEVYPFKATLFYPSIWFRYAPFETFFFHAELEQDIQTYKYYDTDIDPFSPTVNHPVRYTDHINTQALLLGVGYRQPISSNASLVAMVLYDVLQQDFSPYKDRVDFRIGFNVGF